MEYFHFKFDYHDKESDSKPWFNVLTLFSSKLTQNDQNKNNKQTETSKHDS